MVERAEKPCCLCGQDEDDQLKYGQLFKVDGLIVHHFCMLFSPHLAQNGKDDEGAEGFLSVDIKNEITRASSTSCCYCGRGGATGLCMSMKCKKHYHPSCAVAANGLLQFFGQFKSFCEEHRPRQNVIGRELGESCGICLERTDPEDDHHVLWTPCCRHFFHRSCLQRMAYHFGYFFYCPGCRNKDNVSGFLKHMRHFGIFIPKRDASWELVPNAFGELLERHLVCNVRYCLCSQGRSHQETGPDSPWRLCVCGTCGSAGTHLACSELPETVTSWECPSCTLEPTDPCTATTAARKNSLREFIADRAAAAGIAARAGEASCSSGDSAPPPLTAALSLHEVLSQLDEPEKLIRFTVNPLSGLSVQTRPVSGVRLAAWEPGRRPVTFSADELLPEAVVSADDVRQADLRLWSEHHVAAAEAGGHSSYSAARRRAAAATTDSSRPLAAGERSRWTARAGASNAAPRPSVTELQRIQLSGLPPAAELHAALSNLQCPRCRADFRLLSELTFHYQSHSGEPLFYCRICQQATSQWGSFHLLDHHPDLRAEEWASYVDSTFQQAQALMVRLLLHRRNIQVTLEQSQTIARNLKMILARRGANWPNQSPAVRGAAVDGPSSALSEQEMDEYVCAECNAVLRTQGAVSAHKFFHTDEARDKYADRPYHCSDCHFGGSQGYLVTRHRTLHHRRPQEAALSGVAAPAAVPASVAPRPAPATAQAPTCDPAPIPPSTPTPAPASASTTFHRAGSSLPVSRTPSQSTIAALVPESAVKATMLPSGKCKCPHCGKVSQNPSLMKTHLYWHTKEAERSQRAMAYHCPLCYFAANKGQIVFKHLTHVHKKSVEAFRKLCQSCRRPIYNPERHKCLLSKVSLKSNPKRKANYISPVKKVPESPQKLAMTASGETITMPSPVLLPGTNKRGEDYKCKLCGKVGTKESVRIHMKFHTPGLEREGRRRPAHCPLCFFSSTQADRIAVHLLRLHNIEPSTYETQCETCKMTVYNTAAHARFHRAGRGDVLVGGDVGGQVADARLEVDMESEAATASPPPSTPLNATAVAPAAAAGSAPGSGGVSFLVAAGSLMACGNSQSRLDCPFCDAFFDSKRMYDRHLVLNHLAGTETRNTVCRFRFCCAEGSGTHYKLFHKGSEDRAFRCSQCDSTYTCAEDLRTHTARQHADESVPAFQLREDGHCWCSNLASGGALSLFKFHLIAYHSVLVRGFPGPRVAPYSCPKCPAKLEYRELLEHMRSQHNWTFSPGDEYLGSGRPRDMEVGCPLCHRTASFERMFLHMQEKHQWAFLESNVGARERKSKLNPLKARNSAIVKAGKLVRQAAVRQIAAASHSAAPESVPVTGTSDRSPSLYDCPFCDAFFNAKGDYAVHGRKFHSGMENSIPSGQVMCTARYCYSWNESRHSNTYHKNYVKRTYSCDKCDGRFSSLWYLEKHRAALHSRVRPARVVLANVVCRCDTKNRGVYSQHIWSYHFLSARLPPGPRPEPYKCPECGISMVFDHLKRHLTQDHCWRLKESGPDLFKMNAKVFRNSREGPSAPRESVASKVVASIPRSVSVTALPSAEQTATKLPIALRQDVMRALPERLRVSQLAEDPTRIDCPFCDAFFLARNRYMRHMRLAHSGSNGITESTCTYRYCYNMSALATTEKHITTFHKGAAALVHKCSFCDRMARSERSVSTHAEISHKSQMQLGVQVGDVAECSCDAVGSECESKSLLWMHYVHNHSVQVRSYPGPRSQTYDCPVCPAKLGFRELLDHLQSTHMWLIKNEGEEAFGLNRLDNRNFLDSITVLPMPGGAGQSKPPEPTRLAIADNSGSAPVVTTSVTVTRHDSEAVNRSHEANQAATDVIPCPFCDYFFDHAEDYERHALTNHSGFTRPPSMCPVQYCCAQADSKHIAYFHKTLLKIKCRSCDASFRTTCSLNKHIMRAHKWTVDRSDAENSLHRLCSCSVDNVVGIHLHSCHSIGVRGPPGPRKEPYLCPTGECSQRFLFADLVDHLTEDHQWNLKKNGDVPFGDSSPSAPIGGSDDPGSSQLAVSGPGAPKQAAIAGAPKQTVIARRSTLVKRQIIKRRYSRLTFYCHYCNMVGARDVIKHHQETAHRETHGAFMRFARSCTNKRGLYSCPFCSFNRDRLWLFRRHLSRSAACRHQLGPSAVPWLENPETRAVSDSTGVNESMEEAEVKLLQEPRVPPLKIRLKTSGVGSESPSPNLTEAGSAAIATTASGAVPRMARKSVESQRSWLFRCHFCPTRGTKKGMKDHMMLRHGEAYTAFLGFANDNRTTRLRPEGARCRFACPFCSFSTDRLWLLMPHVVTSSACRSQLGPEHQVWVSQCPKPDEDMVGRIKPFPVSPVDGAGPTDEEQPEANSGSVVPPDDPLAISDSAVAAAVKRQNQPRCASRTLPRKQKKRKGPGSGVKYRCRYCNLVGGKTAVWRHRGKAHADIHDAFLTWAKSRADVLGMLSCPRASCDYQIREKWQLRAHVSQTAECRSQLPDNTPWLERQRQTRRHATSDSGAQDDALSDDPGGDPDEWVDAGEASAGSNDDGSLEDVLGTPEMPSSSVANAIDEPEVDSTSPSQKSTQASRDAPDRSGATPDLPKVRLVTPSGTPATSVASAVSATASVQIPPAFECLKCSAMFSEKALLIAHSESKHGVRKKRTLTPDKTQLRIDSFFKRAKVD